MDIWFAEDIRNALLAANEASAATAAVIAEVGGGPSTGSGQRPSTGSGQRPSTGSEQSPSVLRQAQGSGQALTDSTELLAVSLRAYREGYKAALTTVALAFGIAPQAIALSPFDCAQDRPFDELGTMQAQDKVLQVEARDATPQRGGEPEVTYLSPELGGG
ncbi:MAG: hypothetical protein GTN71_08560 [Anaerolineae bacterium]|nr:hypothetical protein [Anaerolineae bacterium]